VSFSPDEPERTAFLLPIVSRRLVQELNGCRDVLPVFDFESDFHRTVLAKVGLEGKAPGDAYHGSIAELNHVSVHVEDAAREFALSLFGKGLGEGRRTHAAAEKQRDGRQDQQSSPHLHPTLPRNGRVRRSSAYRGGGGGGGIGDPAGTQTQ
jgi:hypothetical protein